MDDIIIDTYQKSKSIKKNSKNFTFIRKQSQKGTNNRRNNIYSALN